jgi:hypothetical protein
VSVPAAILGELGHQTSGNAIRAYTATGTTATLLSVYQESSVFTGTGLTIDLGNTGTGSGSFNSGYFMNLKKAGTSKFVIDSNGYVVFAPPPDSRETPRSVHAREGFSCPVE